MSKQYSPPREGEITGIADGCFQVVRAIVFGIAAIVVFFFIIAIGQGGGRSGSVDSPGVYPYNRSREIEEAMRRQRAQEKIRGYMRVEKGRGS